MSDDHAPSSAWRASFDNGLLVVSAGADQLFAVDDVDPATAEEVLAAWGRGSLRPGELSPRAREVVEELIEGGIVARGELEGVPRTVAVRWVGRPDPQLERHLRTGIAESPRLGFVDEEAVLLLVVRTNGRLVELYESAEPAATPHLLLDVAYHHTVSLGPLVVAGETACLACLAGRIGAFWGDPVPPERPAVLESPALAAALAVRELEAIVAEDVRLANATAAYDLSSHRVSVGSVYKLPWCPVCGDRAAPNGSIDLSWADAV